MSIAGGTSLYALLGGAVLYGLAVGGLYLVQDGLLFPRSVAQFPTSTLPPGSERIELVAESGDRLVGNLVPARRKSRGLLLGFPGNAWNADDLTTFLALRLDDVDVAVFHYRGYAPSEGTPSEAALFADALRIHDHLVERLRPEHVLATGFSLGSGVAAHLAAQRPLRGVILVTPFDSIEAVAASRYAWAPVKPLLRHPFRSSDHLRGLAIPAAVIMADDDRVVPRQRSEALIEALSRPVMVEVLPGTHNGIYDTPAIDDALRRALDAVTAAH